MRCGKRSSRGGNVAPSDCWPKYCRQFARIVRLISHRPAGKWTPVPRGAVVHNAANRHGEAIVWWSAIPVDDEHETGIFIRCFMPGDGRVSISGPSGKEIACLLLFLSHGSATRP